MLFTFLAVVIALLALWLAYHGLKLLAVSEWILGFLRGLWGLGLLACASAVVLVALDIYSYKESMLEQPIATISFDQIEDQHYDAVLVTKDGGATHFDLRGDQWQLDARIVKWKGYLASLGLKPAYRLERLSGRYFDIEQETTAKRTAHQLGQSRLGLDTWRLFNLHPDWLPVIDATYGAATYLPIKDKAIFEVNLSSTGLVARPKNAAAQEAVDSLN